MSAAVRTLGVYPGATFHADTIGCYGRHCSNDPRLFVDHIMAGWKSTLDSRAWREGNGVSVTFGIGRDGSVSQYRNIFQSHWGNGIHNPRTPAIASNPHTEALAQIVPLPNAQGWHYVDPRTGANWLNTHSISFEHEGMPGDPWPEAMVEATIAVKRWCLEEMRRAGLGFARFDPARLAGHFEIDAVNKSGCPGPHWPRARIVAALMEDEPMTPQERKELDELKAMVYYGIAGYALPVINAQLQQQRDRLAEHVASSLPARSAKT